MNNLETINRKRQAIEISSPANTKRKKHEEQIISDITKERTFTELFSLNEIRKRTFSHWPLKTPARSQMIESGFFGCNVGDRVICIYCHLICQQWIGTDDPRETHRLLSPNCCFVKSNLLSSNLVSPVILNETSNVLPNVKLVPIQERNQRYSEIPTRHTSFSTWPKDQSLPAIDDLAKAGFFYSGTNATVTCFYCNGSLRNWGVKDNPTIEHARWFPHCLYIKQFCGDELYNKIQQSKRVTQHVEQQKKNSTHSETNSSQTQIPDDVLLSKLVAARLDLPVAQRLMDKFRMSIIKRCYEDQLRLKLDDFSTDSDLYLACLILQKQIEIIDGKRDNIIIPSKKLQEIIEKIKLERETCVPSNELIKSYDTELTDEKQLACMPCGHVATCVPCGHSLRSCPICRRDIQSFVRVYVSLN
ncbi:unnamed protein product [Didymodactylos carnosus]|uniref:Uncharacterized protein n=1 Tax=Didymodactylos carnosus TaxID=1234261 RepID=A0A814IEI2_9BILA|nr:unnamed protein product [Didymodactylos carnosus]CAF3794645.1 unnamed protein product [Didymodactylos carnosus]